MSLVPGKLASVLYLKLAYCHVFYLVAARAFEGIPTSPYFCDASLAAKRGETRSLTRKRGGRGYGLLPAHLSWLLNISNDISSWLIFGFTCHMFHWNGNAHGPELLFFFDNESWRTETPQSCFTVTLKRWRNHNRSDDPEFTRPYPFSLLLVSALLTFAIHFSLSFIYFSSEWEVFAGF